MCSTKYHITWDLISMYLWLKFFLFQLKNFQFFTFYASVFSVANAAQKTLFKDEDTWFMISCKNKFR